MTIKLIKDTARHATREELLETWAASFMALKAPPSVRNFVRVIEAWTTPGRRYHTLQHLQESLDLLFLWSHGKPWPAKVALALFFHDVVYDPTRTDNEECSARMAHGILSDAGVAVGVIEEVEALIMATRHNVKPSSPDEKLLVDVDLAILGSPPARYCEYVRQVREEFAHVPEAAFRAGRLKVLEGFLDPECSRPIFHTPAGIQSFDAQARANVADEIRRLREGC